jgi:hypothetical protein
MRQRPKHSDPPNGRRTLSPTGRSRRATREGEAGGIITKDTTRANLRPASSATSPVNGNGHGAAAVRASAI